VAESPASVEVLPDVSGIDRVFHYAVPPALAGEVAVGTIVRVILHGRRVRGYVVALGTPVPVGVRPQDILQVVSIGPPSAVVDLCRWAAWRYAGRLRPFLMGSSAPTVVRRLPARAPAAAASPIPSGLGARAPGAAERLARATAALPSAEPSGLDDAVAEALRFGDAVLRLPPATPRLPFVLTVLETTKTAAGDALILVESHSDAVTLSERLQRRGYEVCLYPDQWAEAAAGGRVVIGTRNVALAPSTCSVIVVLDAHSESYRSERAPTFDARVLVAERGRRAGVPVVFVTPCPSLELLEGRHLVTLERSAERNGWPTVSLLDAREEDPREGGYPSRLVSILRAEVAEGSGPERPVVLVLNRKGRARLLACSLCRTVQRCGRCGAALVQTVRPPKGTTGTLVCPSCGDEVPALCLNCGSARMRILRPGVSLAREQLATLLGVEVAELGPPGSPLPRAPVVIGTEAVLHAVRAAGMVGFLDLDHELLSPRFRAAEQALVLLARAARLVGGRSGGGRLVVRTSMPDHDVVRAVQAGTPELIVEAEAERRRLLRLPPVSALAEVSGTDAAGVVGRLEGVETSPKGAGSFLVRAESSVALADAFARLVAEEPAGWAGVDARIEVDPLGV
jgi:primosomal protein N' (replication factor Y)